MNGSADTQLLAGLSALAAALEDVGAPSMIIGGIAVMARGVPRQTIDVDATVWGEGVDVAQLFAVLAEHDIVARIPDAEQLARSRQVLLLRHGPSGTPIDVSLAWLPFEQEALASAEVLRFGGIALRVARAEDLVILKAVAWRDRDRADIERLLLRHGASIDLGRVRRTVGEFAEVLEAPERVAELDEIIERATGSADHPE